MTPLLLSPLPPLHCCHTKVDLRSSEELMSDGSSPAFKGASFCSYKRDPAVARVSPQARHAANTARHSGTA